MLTQARHLLLFLPAAPTNAHRSIRARHLLIYCPPALNNGVSGKEKRQAPNRKREGIPVLAPPAKTKRREGIEGERQTGNKTKDENEPRQKSHKNRVHISVSQKVLAFQASEPMPRP
jgi:hypothetical protein